MAVAIGSTIRVMEDLRSNPWPLGVIASLLSFIAWLLSWRCCRDAIPARANLCQSDEPLLDGRVEEKAMPPPAAIAVAVPDTPEVVEEDVVAISDDDRIAKEKGSAEGRGRTESAANPGRCRRNNQAATLAGVGF